MTGVVLPALLLPVALLLGQATGPRLAPVSDEGRDPAFHAYITKLKAVVARRDEKSLRKLLDPEVITGGRGGKDLRGWEKFRKAWGVGEEGGAIWDVLADLIELGFFRETPAIYVSPYVVWKFPRELDPNDYLVVLRDALPLREKPLRDARAVGTLAFDIVKRVSLEAESGSFDWVEVETAGGVRGFVQATNLRSPLMARAQFSRKDGRWVLVVLDRPR